MATSADPTPTQSRRALVRQEHAADVHQCTVQTIQNWIGKGYITGYRADARTILVDLDEIEAAYAMHPGKMRDNRKAYGAKARIVPVNIVPAAKGDR